MTRLQNEDGSRIVGYARVSTAEQNLDMQRDALEKYGVHNIWTDQVSAVSRKRPGLKSALLDASRPGDTFVVWRLDRLARSLIDLLNYLQDFETRGVKFVSLTEAIDTRSAGGRLIIHVLGAMAEFERQLIAERTRAGIRAARLRGKRVGGKHKMTSKMVRAAQKMRDDGQSADQIVEHFKRQCKCPISRRTVYNYTVGPSRSARGEKPPRSLLET